MASTDSVCNGGLMDNTFVFFKEKTVSAKRKRVLIVKLHCGSLVQVDRGEVCLTKQS